MSDDLDIRAAGAITIDTGTLRAAADRFVGLAVELEEIAGLVGLVQSTLSIERQAWDAGSAAFLLAQRIRDTDGGAQHIAGQLREAAAVYEMAELNAAYGAAAAAGDGDAAARIDRRRSALSATYPGAKWSAWGAQFEYNLMWPSELVRQWTETGQIFTDGAAVGAGVLAYGMARTSQALGRGTIERTERLGGGPVDVRIRQLSASARQGARHPRRSGRPHSFCRRR